MTDTAEATTPKGPRYRVRERPPTLRNRLAARLRRVRVWPFLVVLAILNVAALGYFAYTRFAPTRPQGEVLASVEGAPVTSIDVETEARAAGILPAQLDPAMREALLAHVIDRRLLVAAAHKQGIDANPVFQLDRARADEMALAGVIARRLTRTDTPVGDAAARRYAAANPAMFDARTTFVVDAITTDIGGISETTLKGLDTMADAAQLLRGMRRSAPRTTARLDSATLAPDILKRLDALKPGEVFVMPQGREAMIGTITARVANPLPDADRLAAARAGAEQQRSGAAVDAALAALRKTMRVEYPKAVTR